MRSEIRMPKPNKDEWNRWFAWYPVMASVGSEGTNIGFVPDAPYVWVWWEHVERKHRNGDGPPWLYRLPIENRSDKYYGIVWTSDTTS